MRSFSRMVTSGSVMLVLFLLPGGALATPKAPPIGIRGVSGDLSGLVSTWWLAHWSRGGEPRGSGAGAPAAMQRAWAKAGSSMDPNGTATTPPPPPPPFLPPPPSH
jgi:hypothetical protein